MNLFITPIRTKIFGYLLDVNAENVEEEAKYGIDFSFTCNLSGFHTKIWKSDGSSMIETEMTIEINPEIIETHNSSIMIPINNWAKSTSNKYGVQFVDNSENGNKITIKERYFIGNNFDVNGFDRKITNLKQCAFSIYRDINDSFKNNQSKIDSIDNLLPYI
jgi:hypothetical protein